MESIKPPSLLTLPREILHGIFVSCYPVDLSSLAKSCHTLRSCIKDNRLMHRDTYLNHYDTPSPKFLQAERDWEAHLHRIVKLEKLLGSQSTGLKQDHLPQIVPAVCRLLETCPIPSDTDRRPYSRNVALLTRAFRSRANINSLLCSSTLFARGGSPDQIPASTREARQLSAKLHVLYGVPVNPERHPTHHNARSKIYDLRNYTEASFWGPFMDDHSQDVDWEKLEAIMVVLCFNLRQFSVRTHGRFPQLWRTPFLGAQPYSYVSGDYKTKDDKPDDLMERDPYGITGTWMRVVCFLDYTDLFTYNFAGGPPPSGPRDPLDTTEAIRLISMKLRVTEITDPEPHQGQGLPVVHFTGTSRSMHAGWDPNANSRIRGTVALTPAGEIRWTTWSVFHGEERWRSESIQIGGLRSARGVWGHWFDKDFDPEGPAGPTAFWKMTDEIPAPSGQQAQQGAQDALANVLALQHVQMLQTAGVPVGALQHHLVAVEDVPIAGASSAVDGAAPTVDEDAGGDVRGLHGSTSHLEHQRARLQNADDDEGEENDGDDGGDGDAEELTLTFTDAQGVHIGTFVHMRQPDEDSEDDPDFVPPATDPADVDGGDDDDSDVPPPGADDDVVVEEAYVEEETVDFAHIGAVPDGEELVGFGTGGGAGHDGTAGAS